MEILKRERASVLGHTADKLSLGRNRYMVQNLKTEQITEV